MEHYNRSTITEEPLPVKSKPIAPVQDAEAEQKHKFSLRDGR